MLESGQFRSIRELAEVEKINSSYLSRVLRPTLLAPDVVEAILDGRYLNGNGVHCTCMPSVAEKSPLPSIIQARIR